MINPGIESFVQVTRTRKQRRLESAEILEMKKRRHPGDATVIEVRPAFNPETDQRPPLHPNTSKIREKTSIQSSAVDSFALLARPATATHSARDEKLSNDKTVLS